MASREIVDISDCEHGSLLKCRFNYDADYTPVVVFTLSIVVIFSLPMIVKSINRLIFDRKMADAPKAVDEKIQHLCCRRCRKKVNKDPMDDTQKLSSIAPKPTSQFSMMSRGMQTLQGEANTYTEEDVAESRRLPAYQSKTRMPMVVGEKERRRIIS